jgi:subtilisin family serine protease
MKQIILFCICFLFLTAFTQTAQAAPVYFSQIDANNLPTGATGQGVVVAVLDSGVDIDHPDLAQSRWINTKEIPNDGLDNDNNGYIDDVYGWDFTVTSTWIGRNDPRPKFENGYISEGISHGTAIAGFIASWPNEIFLTAGLAPQAKIMPLRVLTGNGEGDVENVVKAINYAIDNGAKIINLSFVGYEGAPELDRAIQLAFDRGVVVVTAAGNGTASSTSGVDLGSIPAYPACYGIYAGGKSLLAVSSVGSDNKKSLFANFGSGCINISAPGENLSGLEYASSTLTGYENAYASWSGTSFSAALVSGAAALLKSIKPTLSAGQVIKTLVKTVKNISASNSDLPADDLGGLLDVSQALSYTGFSYQPRLVKLKNYSFIYYVDEENIRHLFTNKSVYSGWLAGLKKAPVVQVVSQQDFDQLSSGNNMTAKPGTLVKFKGSAAVYEVLNNARLCVLANSASGKKLFGTTWQKKIIILSSTDMNDYNADGSCVLNIDSVLPKIQNLELIAT